MSSRPSNPDWPVEAKIFHFPTQLKKGSLFHDLIHFVSHTELSYNVMRFSWKKIPSTRNVDLLKQTFTL